MNHTTKKFVTFIFFENRRMGRIARLVGTSEIMTSAFYKDDDVSFLSAPALKNG